MGEVEVRVVGAGQDDGDIRLVIDGSLLRPGTRLDHPSYEKLKTELVRTALEQGYLDAKLTRHELEVDPAQHLANIHLVLDTGGLYRFGTVTIEQDAIDPKLLDRYVRFTEGEPFSGVRIQTPSSRSRTAFSFRWSP